MDGDDLWSQAVALNWLDHDASVETKARATLLLAKATDEYVHYNAFHDLIELCTGEDFSLPGELQGASRMFVEALRSFFRESWSLDDDAILPFKEAFARAAAAGHLYAGYCAEQYFGGDWSKYREHGVPDAFLLMPFEDRPCASSLRTLERGAAVGNAVCKSHAIEWKRDFPWSVCPWGVWFDVRHSCFLPDPVLTATYTWLLVCQRMRSEGFHLPKEMALAICDWIVTASGWEGLVHDKDVSDAQEAAIVKFIPLA
jgi:hypothetical protein